MINDYVAQCVNGNFFFCKKDFKKKEEDSTFSANVMN